MTHATRPLWARTAHTIRHLAALAFLASASAHGAPIDRLCDHPIPLATHGGRWYLEGSLGERPVRLLVTTLGNELGPTLRREVVDSWALTTPIPTTIDVEGHQIPLPPSLAWRIVDDPEQTARRTGSDFADGELGATFLSAHGTVCLDPAGTLSLGDGGAGPKRLGGASSVALSMETRALRNTPYPVVAVASGALSWGALVDFGSGFSTLETDRLNALALVTTTGTWGGSDAIAGSFAERLGWLPHVSAGALEVGPAWLVERVEGTHEQAFGRVDAPGWLDGSLGNDVWSRHRLVLDYRRSILWLLATDSPRPPPVATRVGVSLAFSAEGCPVIRGVNSANTPEVIAALEPGDTVLEIDGLPMCGRPHHLVNAQLSGSVGAIRQLRLRATDGTERTVSVVVTKLQPDPP
jgi:hypothetical protein